MSKHTAIQWAHSSANWQMGCTGCECWNSRKRICYAGTQTTMRAGQKGYPPNFETPTLFLDRVATTLSWGPLKQGERDAKPWIPATMPRLIFLNDMGDTFDAKLPLNWMAPLLPLIAKSEHHFLLLTKRPSRLVEFSDRFDIPTNVWLGTSVTSDKTAGRVDHLRKVRGGGPKFVSFEPLWSEIPAECFDGIQWAIIGGESGENATPCDLAWIRRAVVDATMSGVPIFVKQYGSAPIDNGSMIHLKDSHGGNWDEWEKYLRIRKFPQIRQSALL